MKQTLETRQADYLLRQTQVIMGTQYQRAWHDVVWQQKFKIADEWSSKYGPQVNPEAYNNTISLTMYYNHIGILLKEKIISEKMLVETVTPVIILFAWKRIEPLVMRWRSMYKDESLLEGFEYLVGRIRESHPSIYDTLVIPFE